MQNQEYRLYSFVAGLYLSPLQCGLQTAHAVSEMSLGHNQGQLQKKVYSTWAASFKTIIILNALNSRGVLDAAEALQSFGDRVGLPTSLFREDAVCLNGAPTAAAIILPEQYFNVEPSYHDRRTAVPTHVHVDSGGSETVGNMAFYTHVSEMGNLNRYYEGSPEFEFISFLKKHRLV